MKDSVDNLLGQWSEARPDVDCDGLSIVVRVQMLSKLMSSEAERALAPLDLKLWEYDVLSALRRQGRPYQLPATELAREALLTSGAMTNRIDRLEQRGLVARRADPEDRRGVNVRLTSAGIRIVNEALEARLGAAEFHVAGLSAAERHRLSDSLRKVLLSVAPEAG